jgi:ADP-ribose pyrophosphatase|tara:strand:+ start:183 stop:800 length:618 start_codon:yes stop_codon:yes gene_type:complete
MLAKSSKTSPPATRQIKERYDKSFTMSHKINEKILKIDTIYDGQILSLQKRTIKLQSGKKTHREIVKHPSSVAIIPLIDKETVILIEQYRSALENVILEIPAGTLKHNEKPEDCARRELLEETGYQARNLKKIFVCYTTPGYSDEEMHFYLATDLTYKGKRLEEDENIKTRRIKLDKVIRMISSGTINDMKTICGISRIKSDYQA